MKIIEKIIKKQTSLRENPAVTIALIGDSVTQGCFECYTDGKGDLQTVFDYASAYGTRLKEMLINGETPERDAASLIYKEISAADEICFVCGELTEEKKILLAEIVARLQKRSQKASVLNGTSLSER